MHKLLAVAATFVVAASTEAAPAARAAEVPHARFVDKQGRTVTRLVYAPMPVYPITARIHRESGEGYFALRLRPNGTVAAVEVYRSTGLRELDIAAAQALVRWRFTPLAAPLKVGVPVDFKMRRRITGGTILD